MTDTTPRKGLSAAILSAPGTNCSNGGISAHYPGVVIVDIVAKRGDQRAAEILADRGDVLHDSRARVRPANDREAEVVLVVRALFGGIYVHAEPAEGNAAGKWAMAGGTYIETSDSRFGEIVRRIVTGRDDHRLQTGPVPLHDRYES